MTSNYDKALKKNFPVEYFEKHPFLADISRLNGKSLS